MFNNLKLKIMELFKNMKRISANRKRFFSIIFFFALILNGCSKDDDKMSNPIADSFSGTITANIENGASYNSEISKVFALYEATVNSVTGKLTGKTLGNVEYINGGFTINISEIPASSLINIQTFFSTTLGINGALELSNPDARVLDADFYAISSDGKYVDYFIYTKTGSKPTTCLFVYADSEVTVTSGKNVSMALRKGWNRIYCTPADKKVTSIAPSGMKWFLNKDVK